MRRIWKYAGVIVAAACLSLSPLRADSLSDVYVRMDAAAKTFKAMTSNLNETVYTALAKDTSVSSGDIKLLRKKPGDVRTLVNFTKPDAKMASFDGNTARIYYPKTKLEQVYDVSSKKEMVEQVMALGFGASSAELKASYDVSWMGEDTVDGNKTSHLKLIPKSKDMLKNFREVELWISDSLNVPLQQKFITSSNGDYTQFTYLGLKLTSSLSDKDLQLKTAKDVQIKQVGH